MDGCGASGFPLKSYRFAICVLQIWLFGAGSLLFTQKKSSCRSHRVYLCTECHLTATNVPVAEREHPVAR